MRIHTISSLFAGLWLAACAALPDLRVAYLPPRADISLSITQTIACSEDAKTVSVSFVVDPTIKYAADNTPTGRDQLRYFSFPKHDGLFADSQIAFHLTEDGRLSSLNASSTSQTAAVVTAAIDLGKAASTVASNTARTPPQSLVQPSQEATTLCGSGGLIPAGKDLSIKYLDRLTWPLDVPDPAALKPAAGQEALLNRVKRTRAVSIPSLHVSYPQPDPLAVLSADTKSGGNASLACADPSNAEVVCLRRIRFINLAITVPGQNGEVWSQAFPVPYGKPDMPVPVPTSPAFGKIVTDLTVADSGAVTQIGYTKSTGAAEFLAALAAIITFGATR